MRRPERIEPGPGQESVWDYPRPPAVVPSTDRIRVVHAGRVIADSTRALCVLETSQPPAFYLPPDDVDRSVLVRTQRRTMCEWKGVATYWDLDLRDDLGDGLGGGPGDGRRVSEAAWSYDVPVDAYRAIAGHLAFYAQVLDECWVGDERVEPNPGSFYGGWITSRVVGPFKGSSGTLHW